MALSDMGSEFPDYEEIKHFIIVVLLTIIRHLALRNNSEQFSTTESMRITCIFSCGRCNCNILDNNALLSYINHHGTGISVITVYKYDINDNKITDHENTEIYFNDQQHKWRIDWKNKKLSICKNTNEELCSKNLEYLPYNWNILNNNALALLNEDHLAEGARRRLRAGGG